ncbi:MoaD/ThiS family protein [Desulfohalobiaceae bacterium Ax17]|jgi:sulfur carrier protein ThiS|uniref:MoaD/ThiS family protein n=1 Tax=Desulfovulcanus ferrireducens TaxID=2831190 RepID=UPI0025A40BA0|nr:MoaD/ThiS family protein [Desulfovulcanus ferrireducens]MBT8762553.1 MoaD/ThiS family protein [Desulfovulcanus ferrireducens]
MIEVKCFATLAEYAPPGGQIDLPAGQDVAQLIKKLGIPEDEVKIVFVNGKKATLDTKLKDNDRVGIFPAVGGG